MATRTRKCSRCGGTGFVRCPKCHGSGKVGGKYCDICSGLFSHGSVKCDSCQGRGEYKQEYDDYSQKERVSRYDDDSGYSGGSYGSGSSEPLPKGCFFVIIGCIIVVISYILWLANYKARIQREEDEWVKNYTRVVPPIKLICKEKSDEVCRSQAVEVSLEWDQVEFLTNYTSDFVKYGHDYNSSLQESYIYVKWDGTYFDPVKKRTMPADNWMGLSIQPGTIINCPNKKMYFYIHSGFENTIDYWRYAKANSRKTTGNEVSVTLINQNCWPQDFYVDNKLVATVAAKKTTTFTYHSGYFNTRLCIAGTSNCGGFISVSWKAGKTTFTINPHPKCNTVSEKEPQKQSVSEKDVADETQKQDDTDTRPKAIIILEEEILKERQKQNASQVTVTVTNKNCGTQDFYVDNQLTTTIPANDSRSFTFRAGDYTIKSCTPGTSNCSALDFVTWKPGEETFTILPHPDCKRAALGNQKQRYNKADAVTVTLINQNCWPQDFYVNNQIVVTVAAKSSGVFTFRSGKYTTRACTAGSSNCGGYTSVIWEPGKTTFTLFPHPDCKR